MYALSKPEIFLELSGHSGTIIRKITDQMQPIMPNTMKTEGQRKKESERIPLKGIEMTVPN